MKEILLGGVSDTGKQNSRISGEKLQILFIAVFSLLYVVRDIGGIGFPDIIFSGLCAAVFLVADIGTAIGVYMFTTALTLPHNEIRIFYIAILLIKLLIQKKLRFNSTLTVVTLLMMLIQLIDTARFSSLGTYNYFYNYVVLILNVLIPLVWFGTEWRAKDLSRAMLCYIAGVVLGSSMIMLITAKSIGWYALLGGEGLVRLGENLDATGTMRTSYNANQLSGMCSIAIAILFIAMDRLKLNKITKLICVLIMGYMFFIVLLTRSRTGLLMTSLAAVIYIWMLVVRRKKVMTGIAVFLSLAVIATVIIAAFPAVFESLMSRFVDQDDITNGRSGLFVQYIEAWSSNLWCGLFGYGIGTYQNVVDIWNSPHNFFADVLICWGFTGFVLICITLWKFFTKSKPVIAKSDRLFAFLPAIIAIISSMGGQYLTTGFPHVRLCFLLLAAQGFVYTSEDTAEPSEVEESSSVSDVCGGREDE